MWRPPENIPTQSRLPDLRPTHFVDTNATPAEVPCNGCTLCCRTLIVPLSLEEVESGQYKWAWITKRDSTRLGRALQRKPNGECVYLGAHGCDIHGHAPHVCKKFSCSEMFVKSDRVGRRESIRNGKLPKALWEKGREMAKFMGLMK